jgi:uncharacterized protein DUF928
MKNAAIVLANLVGIALVLALAGDGRSSEAKAGKSSEQILEDPIRVAAASPPMPVYTPPKRGAPGGRIGGGSRGTQRDGFSLSVLAPDHTGLTTDPQPTLYWFISSDLAATSVELTLMDPDGTQPLLENRVSPPVKTGLHSIRLSEYGVRLKPGVPYRWFVALVVDPDRRSKDILAGGFVELVEPPAGLPAQVAKTDKKELPQLYAAAGLWYDAVGSISQLIDAAPNDASLKQQRAALLEQAGLTEVAKLLK